MLQIYYKKCINCSEFFPTSKQKKQSKNINYKNEQKTSVRFSRGRFDHDHQG